MNCVYFIQEGSNNFFKIGSTTDNVESRLCQLQVGNPRELKVFGIIECDNPEVKEREIHDVWGSRCVRGEWFDFSARQACDILRAYDGHKYVSESEQEKVKPQGVGQDLAPNTERESIILMAYERAIQRRTNPSTGYIEKITEELGNRVPRTSVWQILKTLRLTGRLPVLPDNE